MYKLLGVDPGASDDLIKKAFKRRAAQYHPDRNHAPDAAERMAEVDEAHRILMDPVLRAEYDKTGEIPSKQPSMEDIVRKEIIQRFLKLGAQNQYVPGPYIKEIRKSFLKDQAKLQNEVRTIRTSLENAGANNVAKEGIEDDIFAGAMGYAIEQMTRQLEHTQKALEQTDAALEVLEPYEDTFVEAPQNLAYTISTSTGTSTQ